MFVLPTYREGFPLVIVEAMAAGLPIIATPVGAIRDIVRDSVDGFLVPVCDAAALEARLRNLIDDPALRRRMGENARQRTLCHFARDTVLDELAALYRSLIGGGEFAGSR